MAINDGGQAFPSGESYRITDLAGNTTDCAKGPLHKGMSLRDWFAGQAMAALIAKAPFIDREGENGTQTPQADINQFRADMAESAYYYADAMLKARNKAK